MFSTDVVRSGCNVEYTPADGMMFVRPMTKTLDRPTNCCAYDIRTNRCNPLAHVVSHMRKDITAVDEVAPRSPDAQPPATWDNTGGNLFYTPSRQESKILYNWLLLK